jgi:hypothetical protein
MYCKYVIRSSAEEGVETKMSVRELVAHGHALNYAAVRSELAFRVIS